MSLILLLISLNVLFLVHLRLRRRLRARLAAAPDVPIAGARQAEPSFRAVNVGG
ncbi:hypothetical protein [Pontivivens insulae]|uniref:Uncharacterized protein n=1 Tax=Pontivivens insulae TaxID=1639689 RepID=A0A2R8AB73_9RHOB|nr:hypothetical protein [Pontivivens insulae]RED11343.1 hypothetical protein DFR53_3378 [Pontivivens insulae]SPF29484.1 hypothetical protein POI8812_01795 [Pontivivens insulae]